MIFGGMEYALLLSFLSNHEKIPSHYVELRSHLLRWQGKLIRMGNTNTRITYKDRYTRCVEYVKVGWKMCISRRIESLRRIFSMNCNI